MLENAEAVGDELGFYFGVKSNYAKADSEKVKFECKKTQLYQMKHALK